MRPGSASNRPSDVFQDRVVASLPARFAASGPGSSLRQRPVRPGQIARPDHGIRRNGPVKHPPWSRVRYRASALRRPWWCRRAISRRSSYAIRTSGKNCQVPQILKSAPGGFAQQLIVVSATSTCALGRQDLGLPARDVDVTVAHRHDHPSPGLQTLRGTMSCPSTAKRSAPCFRVPALQSFQARATGCTPKSRANSKKRCASFRADQRSARIIRRSR